MKKMLLGLMFLSSSVFSDCSSMYLNSTAPVLNVPTVQVCKTHYVVQFNTNENIPITSSEYLTKADVQAASSRVRVNQFHSESPSTATVKEYSKSGFDLGHMSPDKDQPDTTSEYESFSMNNITPQYPKMNRYTWESIEVQVRKEVLQYGDAYVVTGDITSPTSKKLGNVVIPDALFKAVYTNNQPVVYVVTNDINGGIKSTYDLKDFIVKYNINPFPSLK